MNGTIKIIIIWVSVFLLGYVLNKSFNKLEGMTQGKPISVYDQKVKYTSHDKQLKVTTPGANKLDTDVKKKIDMCDAINSASGGPSCDNLAGTECGYCLDSDTAMYGDANGPIENVCQTKHWSPPGANAVYECKKALERRICRGMKNCGDVAGKKSICGWCPATEEGLVKKLVGSGYDVKYPEVDSCDWRAKPKQAKWLGWGGSQPTPPAQAPAAASGGVTTFTGLNRTGTSTVRPVGTYTA